MDWPLTSEVHDLASAQRRAISAQARESARQKMRRLQSVRSGLFFAAFLPNIQIFGYEIVKNYPRWGHFSLRRLLPPRLLAHVLLALAAIKFVANECGLCDCKTVHDLSDGPAHRSRLERAF